MDSLTNQLFNVLMQFFQVKFSKLNDDAGARMDGDHHQLIHHVAKGQRLLPLPVGHNQYL